MPFTDDGYEKLTEDEIYDRLRNKFEAKLGKTVEPGDLVSQQLRAEAETLAENQEEAMQRVYKSAYLADAEGKNLDKLAQYIGLTRREAVPATGLIEFSRDDIPTTSYTVPKNSKIQTRGSSPIEFVTTNQTTLAYIDGFEDNLNAWEGDKADFSRVQAGALTESYSLEVPATDAVALQTVRKDYKVGTTFNLDFAPSSDSITSFKFGMNDADNYHELIVDTSSGDIHLRTVVDGTEDALSTEVVAVPTGTASHVELDWSLYDDLRATIYESSARTTKVGEATLAYEPEWNTGAFEIESNDGVATALVDEVATSVVTASIRGINGGVHTNVGPDTITVATSGLTGIENITNPVPTGDLSFVDRNLSPLILGQEREDDEDLRQRAFENSSIGGAASLSALKTILSEVAGVQSVTVKRNREDTVDGDGRPPHCYEPIIYGGLHGDIAQALHDTASVDSNDVAGYAGNEVTYDIESPATGQTETYRWSEPIEVQLDVTLDLVVDENYVGDTSVQSMVVEYIGGTDIDGSQLGGLANGEDVYEAVLAGKLVDPAETGIWEVDSLTIDDNSDGSDDTTTTASGADVYAVTDDKVAVTDARDGSITVNTTLK
ncbi:hypothetical protein [Halomonas sp.]|uniref:hypothetical protein n=1 Tax=Halomonas sp. TaxID=1486246 RepID=UPI0035636F7D